MTIQSDYEAMVDRKAELLKRQAYLDDNEAAELAGLCERIDAILSALYPTKGAPDPVEAVRKQMRAKHDSQPTLRAVRAVNGANRDRR